MLSRGNNRATVFRSAHDYEDFIELLDEARRQSGVELLAFCIMPNHFHVVARFDESVQLSALMQWWLTSHVRRHHERQGTTGLGHVWQGRFKSFPIQEDEHLLTVLRYVLRNPVRARLVETAWAWRWSSLWHDAMLSPWPVEPPASMANWLGAPPDDAADEDLRTAISRGAPFGDDAWRADAARRWGIEATIAARGRPKTAGRILTNPPSPVLTDD